MKYFSLTQDERYLLYKWRKDANTIGFAVLLKSFKFQGKFTTLWIREIVKKYARKAEINKRIHPHLFRHQILTYLTTKGIVELNIFVKNVR